MSAPARETHGTAWAEDAAAFQTGAGRRVAPWIADFRKLGLDGFRELGFPAPKQEDWRFTNVGPIAEARLPFAASPGPGVSFSSLAPFLFDSPDWTRLVFADGHFVSSLSSIGEWDGADIQSLADIMPSGHPVAERHIGQCVPTGTNGFTALNAACLNDGVYINVGDGETVKKPVLLVYLAVRDEPFAAHPRNLIIVGDHAQLTVVELFVSLTGGAHFTNALTEISAGRRSVVDYYRIQQESPLAYHVSSVGVRQEELSSFSSASINLGGALTRNNLSVELAGEACTTVMNGLSIVDGDRHVDNQTALDHASPRCESEELYKAIVDDRARSVFNGKIYVRPGAQKTDAKQTNRNLLLSKNATVDTKPQLEIFADDVKCTHGATVGQLDENQLFYLRSRAMDEQTASQLLTYGFANDIIERISLEPVRAYLHRAQSSALHTAAAIGDLQ